MMPPISPPTEGRNPLASEVQEWLETPRGECAAPTAPPVARNIVPLIKTGRPTDSTHLTAEAIAQFAFSTFRALVVVLVGARRGGEELCRALHTLKRLVGENR